MGGFLLKIHIKSNIQVTFCAKITEVDLTNYLNKI